MGRAQRAARVRPDQQPAEPGVARPLVDAEHEPVQPFADRAERVVVERVHPGRLEAALLRPAVPALPDRGGAVVHHVPPGRRRVLLQQPVGDVGVPSAAEHRQQVADPGEPGGQVPVRRADRRDQVAGRGRPQLLREQLHVQAEHVGGLGARGELAVGGQELVRERGPDLGPERPVPGGLLGVAGRVGDLGHQRGVVGPVRGGQQLRRRLVVARREPVVVRVTQVTGAQVVRIVPLDEVHPAGHRGEVPPQDRGVAVHLVQRPRHDHARIPPGRRTSPGHVEPRRNITERPRRVLGVGHVIEPLVEERRDVPVVAGGAGEHLGIAQPAEPLVALRAVGRHADEVAPLAPVDVAEQLVEPRFRALERAGGRDVGVRDPGHDVVRAGLARIAVKLRVPEAVQREARLERRRAAGAAELVGLPGGTQVVGVQGAVGGQHLGVPDPHAGAGRAVRADPQPAGQVLAEVGDEPPGVVRRDADRPDLLGDPDRRPGVGDQRPAVPVPDPHRPPAGRVEAGRVPAVRLAGGLVPLTHEQVGVPDRGERGLPGLVGDHLLGGPVGQADDQLGEQFRGSAVVRAGPLGVEAQEARVPPVGQQRAEHVLARADERGHVVALVRDALRVVRPARGEHRVADPVPVQPGLVQAERRHMQPGPGHRLAHGETPAQVRGGTQGVAHRVSRAGPGRGLELLPDRAQPDPARPPAVGRVQLDFEPGWRAPLRRRVVLVPDPDPPGVPAAAGQRVALVADIGLVTGPHPAALPDCWPPVLPPP